MAGGEKNIHKGHRGRMRDKFIEHGERVFNTYELVEMMLYSVIPCVNTNPQAKLLMEEFGSIEGVFSATDEEIRRVKGIGNKTVGMLRAAADFADVISRGMESGTQVKYEDYNELGDMISEKMKNVKENRVMMLLFNNEMGLIGEEIISETDYGSAAVRSEKFVSSALKHHASIAVIAHNHPFGPLFPTNSDVVTNALVESALLGSGIFLLEHYIVSGESYVGFMNNLGAAFRQSLNVKRFLESKANKNG